MRWKKATMLFVTSLGLSIFPLTVFFSGGLLSLYRKYVGRLWFWLSISSASLVLGIQVDVKFASLFFLLAFCMGVFVEAKAQECGDLKSGLIAIMSSLGVGSLSLGLWLQNNKMDLVGFARTEMQESLKSVEQLYGGLTMDLDLLLVQIPSVIVISLIIYVWVAIMVERALVKRAFIEKSQFITPIPNVESHASLRLPDWLIWPSLISILFRFFDVNFVFVNEIALNCFNVFLVIYFFQGLAVVNGFLETNEVPPMWRVFWYALIFNMYAVVSMLGFFDYWVDFRKRFFSTRNEIKN